MLKPDNGQASLFDVESIAPNLIDPGSFAMRLRANADGLFSEARFADMYSDLGRPAHSPKTMIMALILQQKLNLSDRQMASATRYHLDVKAALGLPLDHTGIPKTCYSEFRSRLLTNGKEAEAFNAVNRLLQEQGLLTGQETVIVDACHLEADAATPNPRLLIRKATRRILRLLDRERPDLYKHLPDTITLRKDTEFSGGQEYHLLPEAEKLERFAKAVQEARALIAYLKPKQLSATLRAHLTVLADILEDRADDDGDPLEGDQAPPDRIASHQDPDARWGAKGRKKFFFGYKRTILYTLRGFIADFGLDPGNTPDGAVLTDLLAGAREVFGLAPNKVIGDAAYGSVDNLKAAKEQGYRLVATIKPAPNPRGCWSRDRFHYDADARSLSCPEGQSTTSSFPAPNGEGLVFRFQPHQCGVCPSKSQCCPGDFRSVKVAETVPGLDEALAYGKTDDYKADMKQRPVIEGKNAELTRFTGGRRTRFRTLNRVFLGEVLRCAVVNLKRLFKLVEVAPSGRLVAA